MYELKRDIPVLYHSTTSVQNKNAILRDGLKTDYLGMVYLSEKPIGLPAFPYVFRVEIPDQEFLADWREIWHDDDGEPIDLDHQYDETNPYYVYLGNIPPEYIEEV